MKKQMYRSFLTFGVFYLGFLAWTRASVVGAAFTGAADQEIFIGQEYPDAVPPQLNWAILQTFEANRGGLLDTVTVRVRDPFDIANPEEDLLLDVFNFEPTTLSFGSLLASVGVSGTETDAFQRDVVFDLSGSGTSLMAGSNYAIVLSTVPIASGDDIRGDYSWFYNGDANAYSGGNLYRDLNYDTINKVSSGSLQGPFGDAHFSVTVIPEPSVAGALVGIIALLLSWRAKRGFRREDGLRE